MKRANRLGSAALGIAAAALACTTAQQTRGATVTYLGLVNGAGKDVFVNYGTAAGGYLDTAGASASGGTVIPGAANNGGLGTDGKQILGTGYELDAEKYARFCKPKA